MLYSFLIAPNGYTRPISLEVHSLIGCAGNMVFPGSRVMKRFADYTPL
jgi:hypothetical protein